MKHRLLSPELKLAFKLSTPTLFAYVPLGLVFGLIFVNSGYDWYLAPLMSAVVFAGAVQFVTLGMMTEHTALLAILLAALFVAFRNSFYGLSLLTRFNTHKWLKSILIFGLVDATYVILMSSPPRKDLNDIKFCLCLTLLIYAYWVIGTFLGAVLADWIPPFAGLEFVLPCFFMVLVVDYFLASRSLNIILIPVCTSLIAYWITPQHYLLVAIVLSILTIYSINHFKQG